jgi:hypothetical protein
VRRRAEALLVLLSVWQDRSVSCRRN